MANAFNPAPRVGDRYGAPMGRRSVGLACFELSRPLRLVRVRLDSGGYDSGGAYWGLGQRLYCAADEGNNRLYLRARDRDDAKAQLRADAPDDAMRFYR